MSGWRLTVRHSSAVSHEEFDQLDQALAEMRRRAEEIQAEGPLPAASMLRDYQARDQVHARLQLSARGLGKPTAGVDVRGDGSLVGFRGVLRRRELEPEGEQTLFDTVRQTLSEEQQ